MPVFYSGNHQNKAHLIKDCLLLLMLIAAAACTRPAESYPDVSFYEKNFVIIDIRTETEWRQTGIIAGSKTITFFDKNDDYNKTEFLRQLEQVIDKDEEFAIICRSGRRSRIASQILSQDGYRVIDIKGGIKHLPADVKLVPYKP